MNNLKKPSPHDSIRGYAAQALWEAMEQDQRIVLVVGDLGYGVMDKIKEDFPNRFFNPGAAEVCGLGMCVGMALCGLKPVFYSITPFALFRPAEVIRNYLDHELIPVTILCSGLNNDYKDDGFSHFAGDAPEFVRLFKNINFTIPLDKQDAYESTKASLATNLPSVIILRR